MKQQIPQSNWTRMALSICIIAFLQSTYAQYGNSEYILPFTITNPISDPITDTQILLEFDTASLIADGKLQADCDDLRVYDAMTGGNAIDFWLESGCNSTTTRLWVEVPTIPASGSTTVYVNYGDDTLASASNGEATFLFFDDFSSGTIDPAKWNLLTNATIDNTIGQANAPSAKANNTSTNENNLRSNVGLPTSNYAVHASFYDNGFSNNLANTWLGIRGAETYIGVRNGTFSTYSIYNGTAYTNTSVNRSTGWHYGELQVLDCGLRSILDHGAFDSGIVPQFVPATTYFSLYSWYNTANFDDVFVRKLISDGTNCPEPQVEQGNESYPGPGGVGNTSGTSELVLWLKADEGVVKDQNNLVSAWEDQSGNSHDVIQSVSNNQPLFEESLLCGTGGLLFTGPQTNGSNDYLTNTVDNLMNPNNQRTLFVVGDMRDGSNRGGAFLTSRRSVPVFTNEIYNAPTDGGKYIYSDGVSVPNNATVSNAIFDEAKQPFIATFYTEASKKQRFRMNGTNTSVSQQGITTAEAGATGFTVGHREDRPFGPSYGQTWDGHIFEIILFDRQLTTAEIEAVEAYLDQKYSISGSQVTIPATEPGSGYALHFDGTGGFVDAGNNINFGTDDFTLECWIKTEQDTFIGEWTGTNDYGRMLINKGLTLYGTPANAGYGLAVQKLNNENQLVFYVNATNTLTVSGLEENQLYHIAAVREGTTMKSYVNGLLEASTNTASIENVDTNIKLTIGALNREPGFGSSGVYYKGMMDEVRIWRKALTVNEIRDYLAQKVDQNHSSICSLEAYFRFDNGTGTVAKDIYRDVDAPFSGGLTWQLSEMPIGDESTWNYGGNTSSSTLTYLTETVNATATAGTLEGIHTYVVTETPNSTVGLFGDAAYNHYYGVHVIQGDGATYDFQYDYSGNPLEADEVAIQLFKRDHNAQSTWQNSSATLSVGNNTITAIGESTEYILDFDPAILPITWGDFVAVAEQQDAALYWNTLSEIDNSHFEIEHSIDGVHFNKIGELAAHNTASAYAYRHEKPGAGVQFYRLKQVDINGDFEYSDIRLVEFEAVDSYVLYPNPVNYQLFIDGPDETINVQIIGTDGLIWKDQALENGRIIVTDLPAGLYIMQIETTKTKETLKFIKR